MEEREQLVEIIKENLPYIEQLEAQEDAARAAKELAEKKKKAFVLKHMLISYFLSAVIAGIVGLIAGEIIGLLAMIAGLVVYWRFAIKEKKDAIKKAEEETAKLAEMLKGPGLDWLPFDYRYPLAAVSIAGYVLNRRADSLKDAINLFEDEVYKARMIVAQRT